MLIILNIEYANMTCRLDHLVIWIAGKKKSLNKNNKFIVVAHLIFLFFHFPHTFIPFLAFWKHFSFCETPYSGVQKVLDSENVLKKCWKNSEQVNWTVSIEHEDEKVEKQQPQKSAHAIEIHSVKITCE